MTITSLLSIAFIVVFTVLPAVEAATVYELCAAGGHCI